MQAEQSCGATVVQTAPSRKRRWVRHSLPWSWRVLHVIDAGGHVQADHGQVAVVMHDVGIASVAVDGCADLAREKRTLERIEDAELAFLPARMGIVEAGHELAPEADLAGAAPAAVVAAEDAHRVPAREQGVAERDHVLAQATDLLARQVFRHQQDTH